MFNSSLIHDVKDVKIEPLYHMKSGQDIGWHITITDALGREMQIGAFRAPEDQPLPPAA